MLLSPRISIKITEIAFGMERSSKFNVDPGPRNVHASTECWLALNIP
jgi:hypothetical protein